MDFTHSGQILDKQVQESFAANIMRIMPNGMAPIFAMTGLAKKKFIPESNGTLKTDTPTFGLMVFAVITILAALAFFPALTLGPIAEYFSIY